MVSMLRLTMFSIGQQLIAQSLLSNYKLRPNHLFWYFPDAQIKYSYILYTIENIFTKPLTILDLGCGDGHLLKTIHNFAPTGSISYGVDILPRRFFGGVIPRARALPKNLMFTGKKFLRRHKQGLRWKRMDCIEFLTRQKDESFDLIIDSCSIIHFNSMGVKTIYGRVNEGVLSSLDQISRILRPGGHFIMVSDVLASNVKQSVQSVQYEFMTSKQFRNIFSSYFSDVQFDCHPSLPMKVDLDFNYLTEVNGSFLRLGVIGAHGRKSKSLKLTTKR